MRSTRGGLVTMLAAGALLVLPMSNTRVTRIVSRVGSSSSDPKVLYNAHEKEFWLSTDEFDYVRPGLVITVNSITFDVGLHAVVDLTYTDSLGVPLDRAGVLTPGAISMSFVLAWWDPNARQYTSYTFKSVTSSITGMTATQAAADSGGKFQDIDIGHSVYTFKAALPSGYDATATTTLGIYATRDTTAVLGKAYYANVEQDFVPNGSPVNATWDIHLQRCVQYVPRPAVGARRVAPGRQALRPLPSTADDRPGHGQHGGFQGDGAQDPHGVEPSERRGGYAVPDHRVQQLGQRLLDGRLSRRTSATARRATRGRRRRRSRPTGSPSLTARPVSPATTTSTLRPGRTIRAASRPTTASARPATYRPVEASSMRRSWAPTRSPLSRRS